MKRGLAEVMRSRFSTPHSVDDLQSIDDLELYIKQSVVMLLFLSKGCISAGIRSAVFGTCTAD